MTLPRILGLALLAGVILMVAMGVVKYYDGSGPGEEAKALQAADKAVLAVCQYWEPEALRANASEELSRSAKLEWAIKDLAHDKDWFGGMPPVDTNAERAKTSLTISFNVIRLRVDLLFNYERRVRFDKREGIVRAQMIQQDDGWKIKSFKVDVPA